jgi:hypothetical protein
LPPESAQDGIDCAATFAVEPVQLPSIVFAPLCAMLPSVIPLVVDWKL